MRLLALFLVWLTAAPVALAYDPAPPPEGLARLVFYRETHALFIAVEPEIIINGKSIGRSLSGEVFFRDAKPGRYELFLSDNPKAVTKIETRPGELTFFKIFFTLDAGGPGLVLQAVDPAYARGELASFNSPEEGNPALSQSQ